MTDREITHLTEELAGDLSKFDGYSEELKKAVLFCCWNDISFSRSHSSESSNILSNSLYRLYFQAGGLLSLNTPSAKIQEFTEELLKAKEADLIVLTLERGNLDESLQQRLVDGLE